MIQNFLTSLIELNWFDFWYFVFELACKVEVELFEIGQDKLRFKAQKHF